MIKDSKRKAVIIRKSQQPPDHHSLHHHQSRITSCLNHHHHNHHHHHPHHRLHPHLHHEQRHLHQLHHLHGINEKNHQQRRQHNHARHSHHPVCHDRASGEKKEELLPQQPHSHQRHHIRLQNNSQFPLHLQQREKNLEPEGRPNHQPPPETAVDQEKGLEPVPSHTQLQGQIKSHQFPQQEGKEDHAEESFPVLKHQQRSLVEYQKGGGNRERYLHPHCRSLVKGITRARSATPPALHKVFPATTSENYGAAVEIGDCKPGKEITLREPFAFPIAGPLDCTNCNLSPTVTSATSASHSLYEVSSSFIYPNKNKSSIINTSSSITDATSTNSNSCVNSHITSSRGGTAPGSNSSPTLDSCSCGSTEAMHLPLHTSLPDGCPVTVDVASEQQVSQMYGLIQAAAILGEGYGVDEYPTEEDFRQEIRGGHTFVVTARGAELSGEDLEEELPLEDVEEEEEEEEELERGDNSCTRGRLIAAFSLATSKFYRGNDVKVRWIFTGILLFLSPY